MDNAEVDKVQAWMHAYSSAIRMEYGMSMALAGFDDDIIVEVQATVARNMIVWLQEN